MNKCWLIPCILLPALILSACFYPTRTITAGDKTTIPTEEKVDVSTKVHLLDGSLVLFQEGFTRGFDNTLRGIGRRYGLDRNISVESDWRIPLDSIIGLEYYEEKVSGSRVALGSVMLTAGRLAGIKAAFGSCPTIYTSDGSTQHLEAECFSGSIGSRYEWPDLDRLEQRQPSSGRFTLRMKNEALETHYTDQFRMAYADHPPGTTVFPTPERDLLAMGTPLVPLSAINSDGLDVLPQLRYQDSRTYTIDTATVRRMFAERERDWVDFRIVVPPDAEEITIALRARNSLQSTILFYDVMLRDQGPGAMDWSRTLNSSLWYAWRLSTWYKQASGIEILVEQNGEFEKQGRIGDSGPITWKPIATRIPLGRHGDTVTIRLAMVPDSWSIDWVGFDTGEREEPVLQEVPCSASRDHRGEQRDDIVAAIHDDDGRFLVNYPGEWLDLSFDLPPPSDGLQRTLFIYSKGYYVEWIRPEWVKAREHVRAFDISEPQVIRQRLAELWVARKMSFEREFFESKIPIAEPEKPW